MDRAEAIAVDQLNDPYVLERTWAEVTDIAYDASGNLKDVIDRSQTDIMDLIREKELYRYFELASFKQYYESKIAIGEDGNPTGHGYESMFVVDYIYPILRQHNFDPAIISGSKKNYTKMIVAVPYMRDVLKDVISIAGEIKSEMAKTEDPEELQQLQEKLDNQFILDTRVEQIFENLMVDISTPNKELSVNAFREKIKGIAKEYVKPVKALGLVMIEPDGYIFQISANTAMGKAIMQMTGSVIDWHNGDIVEMARQVSTILLKEEVK